MSDQEDDGLECRTHKRNDGTPYKVCYDIRPREGTPPYERCNIRTGKGGEPYLSCVPSKDEPSKFDTRCISFHGRDGTHKQVCAPTEGELIEGIFRMVTHLVAPYKKEPPQIPQRPAVGSGQRN